MLSQFFSRNWKNTKTAHLKKTGSPCSEHLLLHIPDYNVFVK